MYVRIEERVSVDSGTCPDDSDQLTYALLRLCHASGNAKLLTAEVSDLCEKYWRYKTGFVKSLHFQYISDVRGALANSASELERRLGSKEPTHVAMCDAVLKYCSQRFYEKIAVPYLEYKCRKNGDVFPQ